MCGTKLFQLCPTLCDPVDSSLTGSSVHGILQARTLERVAFPSPSDLPNPGIEPESPALQADSLPAELKHSPWLVSNQAVDSLISVYTGGNRLRG